MTAVVPLRPERFAQFRADLTSAYADDIVRSLRWPEEGAVDRACAEFDKLLPHGVSTPGQCLFEILDEPGGQAIGSAWLALVETPVSRDGFLYNIRISTEFRGRGHAKAAMELIEAKAVDLGVSAISLHVFGFNTNAQALYRALGYGITGFNMIKRIDRGDG